MLISNNLHLLNYFLNFIGNDLIVHLIKVLIAHVWRHKTNFSITIVIFVNKHLPLGWYFIGRLIFSKDLGFW